MLVLKENNQHITLKCTPASPLSHIQSLIKHLQRNYEFKLRKKSSEELQLSQRGLQYITGMNASFKKLCKLTHLCLLSSSFKTSYMATN